MSWHYSDDESRTQSVGIKSQPRRKVLPGPYCSDSKSSTSSEFERPGFAEAVDTSTDARPSDCPSPDMDWNNSGSKQVRTSFQQRASRPQNSTGSALSTYSHTGSEVILVSDDSDAEDNSEGGILLNVSSPVRTPKTVSSSQEDGEVSSYSPKPNIPALDGPVSPQNVHRGPRVLADLSSADLDKQFTYALYHLRRDQIDLSRPVVCLACLVEGHAEEFCIETSCMACGGFTKHPSRCCPMNPTCDLCRSGEHSGLDCSVDLKITTLSPCSFCGSSSHIEARCAERFFPEDVSNIPNEVSLWISCAWCGDKEHLAHECPDPKSVSARQWSLRRFKGKKITNLGLDSGNTKRDREARNRGLRPEGIRIKGIADRYERDRQVSDEDDFAARLASSSRRRSKSPRRPDRFAQHEYRPRNQHSYYAREDRYMLRDRHDRDDYPRNDYARDDFVRNDYSRDDYPRGGYARDSYREGDSYHPRRPSPPPLPRGPPPPSNHQNAQNGSEGNKKKKPRKKKGAGLSETTTTVQTQGIPVRPMPSAARKAWRKGRT